MGKVYTVVKTVTGEAAELGIDLITTAMWVPIANAMPHPALKVCAYMGGIGGSAIIGMKVHEYYDELFDEIAELGTMLKTQPKEAKKVKVVEV